MVGEVADVANGIWYAAEGNHVDAALSFASAIPLAGYAASRAKAVRYGAKVKENPEYGNRLLLTMKDSRWPAEDGWVKMEQTVDGVEVHYVYNTRTGAADDFKFKDWSE